MKRLLFITASVLTCLTSSLSAELWSDDAGASSYDLGWASNSGATSELGPWLFTDTPGSGTITHQSIDVTTIGGHSALNTSGRGWVTTVTNSTGVTVWEGSRGWNQSFPASAAQEKIFFDIQAIPSSTGSSYQHFAINNSAGTCASLSTGTGYPWFINGTLDVGIPGTTPIRVEYTYINTSYCKIKITDLSGVYPDPFTFEPAIEHFDAGTPESIYLVLQTDSGNQSHMIINNITVDTLGTLPVELDYFMVE